MNSEEKPSFKQKLIKAFDMKLQTFIFGLVLFSLVFYDAFRMPTSGKQLISYSIIALVAGIIFESARLTEKWTSIIYRVLGSLMGSFFFTIHSNYNFENDVQMWPYTFIFLFSIISVLFHDKKLIPKLTEGITLIQSIAVLYWVADNDFLRDSNLFVKLLIGFVVLLSLYSAYQALTYSHLTANKRFVLSLWSSIIMVLFAIDNIIGVFQLEQIENVPDYVDKFYIGLAYFFLGISTIYIIKNGFMLLGFFPDKNTKYSRQYKKLKNDHINRYSDKQVNKKHAILCILFAVIIFVLNYYFQIAHGHLAIWIVFVTFTFVLKIYDRISRQNAIPSDDKKLFE